MKELLPAMDYAKAAGSNKQQKNVKRNQGGSSGRNDETRSHAFHRPLFTKSQKNEPSKTSFKNVPRPPNIYTKNSNFPQPGPLTTKNEIAEEKKNRLNSQLTKFDSPFNWKPRQVKPFNEPETIINRMQEKIKEILDYRKFKWRSFICNLVITYELWRAKKISEAFKKICDLESALVNKSNRGDYFFLCIKDALWHVVGVSKAFLFLEQDMLDKAEELIGCIQPTNLMSRQNQAGIHGVKAAMFMEYGHIGNKLALEEAMSAVELDNTCAEWHFFISKCCGRIRRVAQCHELVDLPESKAIDNALKLDQRNASYKVFLGQLLLERALRDYKKHYPNLGSEHYKKNEKRYVASKHKFLEAVELSPDCPHILIRAARGLMKLPQAHRHLSLINDWIEKAVKLAPNNPMVHHVQAMYHERFDCDVELPVQEYEKAAALGNFGASMDLIRLHHKLNSGDIIKELETLAEQYEQIERRQVIYAQAGSYLLFIRKDIIGAIKYYLKAIDIDCNSYAMMSHKPIFFRMKDPVNMFDVLLEELSRKTDWKSFSKEELKVLKEFRIKAREHEPLPNEKRKRLTVEEILEISRKTSENLKTRLFKRQGQRKKNKIWRGKKKPAGTDTEKKSKTMELKKSSETSEICPPNKGAMKAKKCNINFTNEVKRRDSVSSVDSDYNRGTVGSRNYYILQDSNTILYSKESKPGWCESSGKRPRDSSISSMSSVSSADIGINSQGCHLYHTSNNPPGSQLSVENLKKHDIENSCNSNIRKLSMFSLSTSSSISQASSASTLSVMDRVKQSYAMLGRNNEPTRGKKKYGSTQSLNVQRSVDWNKTSNISKSGSSQSLNIMENPDIKLSKFKSKLVPQDSLTKPFSFMPAFARENSQNDL